MISHYRQHLKGLIRILDVVANMQIHLAPPNGLVYYDVWFTQQLFDEKGLFNFGNFLQSNEDQDDNEQDKVRSHFYEYCV